MKHPPTQMPDNEAFEALERFVKSATSHLREMVGVAQPPSAVFDRRSK
jgi:hypothetical protein